MANRYYGHMWNGYEIPEPEDEEYIYITENGRVYHTNRECTHIRLSVRVVEATEALREYRPCENAQTKYRIRQEDCYFSFRKTENVITAGGIAPD